VAVWVPGILQNFYSVKNNQIVMNSTTTEAGEKNSADLELLEFWNVCYVYSTKLKIYQILLSNIATDI
jgi:hypothetical protein